MLIFYHRLFGVLQTDFLPLSLNSRVGPLRMLFPSAVPAVGSSHKGSQVLLPVVTVLNTLLNWDLKSWCGPPGYQVALACSWIFQYNSQWLGNSIPVGLLAAHRAECSNLTMHFINRCIINVPLWQYPRHFLGLLITAPKLVPPILHPSCGCRPFCIGKLKLLSGQICSAVPSGEKYLSWSLLLISLCPEAWLLLTLVIFKPD